MLTAIKEEIDNNTIIVGDFISVQSYLKKQKKSQINDLTLHLKELEKE